MQGQGQGQGLTSLPWTHNRSYRGRFVQVKWPNQQRQSTEERRGRWNKASIPPGPPHSVANLNNHAIQKIHKQSINQRTVKWAEWVQNPDHRPVNCSWKLCNYSKLRKSIEQLLLLFPLTLCILCCHQFYRNKIPIFRHNLDSVGALWQQLSQAHSNRMPCID